MQARNSSLKPQAIDIAGLTTPNRQLLYFLPAAGAATSFFYFVAFLFFLGYYIGGIANLVFSLVYLVSFVLYQLGLVRFAKHFIVVVFVIQVAVEASYLFPKEAYFQFYYVCAIPLIFMSFTPTEKKARRGYSLLVILALTIIQLRTDLTIRPFNFVEADIILIRNFNLFGSFLLLSFSTFIFLSSTEKSQSKTLELALTDPLTGLYNQRYFNELAEHQLNLSKRSGKTFSLLYIDVDNFKLINDQCGHGAGDEALKSIALSLNKRTRESDILARVGGDEFILLLADTKSAEAQRLAQQIIQSIAISHDDNIGRPLSISIGLSSLITSDTSIGDIVNRADGALYKAKKNGRNQFTVASDQ